MKHIVIIFLLGTFTFLGQSKIDRDLGDFSKVAVYDGINLELVKSDENKVEITGKNTNFVVVKNKNGDLKIRLNLERRFSGDKTSNEIVKRGLLEKIFGGVGTQQELPTAP